MNIETKINEIDRMSWQELIANSSTATWFQTPEAYDFFAQQPDLFKPFIVAIPGRAYCVGYITQEHNPIKQFVTRRAIIIGGPALADDCTADEVVTLMRQVRARIEELGGAIYIETRNFNDYSQWKDGFSSAGFEYVVHLNYHLDCSQEDMLLKNMHESRRRQVKKGLKSGAIIEEAISEQDVKDYYQLLLHLYKTKVKTPLFPEQFFLEFYRKQYGKYLLVKYDGRVIGGIMSPILPSKVIYEWFVCGQDEQNKEQYPSVLATYAAMQYGAQHGLARFDFMGAGKPGDGYGVRVFKQRFGGQEVEYGRYQSVLKPGLYKLGVVGVKILRKIK